MKKFFLPIMLAFLALLAGCGESNEIATSTNNIVDNSAAVKEYMEKNIGSDTRRLLKDDWLTVLTDSNGKIDITINVLEYAPFYIPYVADRIISITQEALKENKAELGRFEICSFAKNNKGIVDGTLVSWWTEDMENGTFISTKDDERKVSKMTVDDLYEYYKDYDELVKKILAGEYDE